MWEECLTVEIKALKCKPSAQIAEHNNMWSKNIVRMRVPSRGKMAAADISCTIPVGLQLCNGDVSDKIAQFFSTSLPAR